jgi:hypothetical protein
LPADVLQDDQLAWIVSSIAGERMTNHSDSSTISIPERPRTLYCQHGVLRGDECLHASRDFSDIGGDCGSRYQTERDGNLRTYRRFHR